MNFEDGAVHELLVPSLHDKPTVNTATVSGAYRVQKNESRTDPASLVPISLGSWLAALT